MGPVGPALNAECAAFGGGITQCESASQPASVWTSVSPGPFPSRSPFPRDRLQQPPAGLRDFRHRLFKRIGIGFGGLVKPADFAHKLPRRGVQFIGGGARLAWSAQHLDASTHASMIAQKKRRIAALGSLLPKPRQQKENPAGRRAPSNKPQRKRIYCSCSKCASRARSSAISRSLSRFSSSMR